MLKTAAEQPGTALLQKIPGSSGFGAGSWLGGEELAVPARGPEV